MTRVERERCQGRRDLGLEVLAHRLALDALQIVPSQDTDPLLLERRFELVLPAGRQLVEHSRHVFADGFQLLRRAHSVRWRLDRSGHQLSPQARYPHHEELVQVAREDRGELDPLQQRLRLVEDLRQDTAVELQPAQLAVEVVGPVAEIRLAGLSFGDLDRFSHGANLHVSVRRLFLAMKSWVSRRRDFEAHWRGWTIETAVSVATYQGRLVCRGGARSGSPAGAKG